MRTIVSLALLVIATVSVPTSGQGIASRFSAMLPPDVNQGYGIRGAGGLRANSILGSGGLRGASIFGSGGVGGKFSGTRYPGVFSGGLSAGLGSGYGGVRASYGTSSRPTKPFSSLASQPTVSPYLNLFRVDLAGGNNFNYSTLVRPQLQQQQLNQQLERQNLQNARRMQAIAAQANFSPEGAKDQFPTGHQTVFNYLGHYYTMPRPRAVQ